MCPSYQSLFLALTDCSLLQTCPTQRCLPQIPIPPPTIQNLLPSQWCHESLPWKTMFVSCKVVGETFVLIKHWASITWPPCVALWYGWWHVSRGRPSSQCCQQGHHCQPHQQVCGVHHRLSVLLISLNRENHLYKAYKEVLQWIPSICEVPVTQLKDALQQVCRSSNPASSWLVMQG